MSVSAQRAEDFGIYGLVVMPQEACSPILRSYIALSVAIAWPVFGEAPTDFLGELREVLSNRSTLVGSECRDSTAAYLEGLRNKTPWALKMFDSTGRPSSGIITGASTFLGFYSECMDAFSDIINTEARHPNFSSRYCLSTIGQDPERAVFPQKDLSSYLWRSTAGKSTTLRFGLCVPSVCSPGDVTELLATFTKKFVNGIIVKETNCPNPPEPFFSNVPALIVTGILLLFLLTSAVATVYDVVRSNKYARESSAGSSRPEMMRQEDGAVPVLKKKASRTRMMLLSFSLLANGRKTLDTSNSAKESLQIFHGLRFFSMAWIIFDHTYAYSKWGLSYRNADDIKLVRDVVVSQILENSGFAVDTFFFMSGVLVVYVSMGPMSEKRGCINWISFYFHRYWRMTPVMMVAAGICATLLPYFADGPRGGEITSFFSDTCQKNWWINLLYLQNFLRVTEICLDPTWYSAVDFQFYAISPLLLYALYKSPKFGVCVISLIILASFVTTFLLLSVNEFPAINYFNQIVPDEKLESYMANIYKKPYCRIGPYLVGMLVGYVIHTYQVPKGRDRDETHTRLEKVLQPYILLGWTMCSLMMIGVLYALWPLTVRGISPEVPWACTYGTISRTVWALGIAWMTCASVGEQGGVVAKILSCRALVPLSRLTFTAYIIHPIVIMSFYGSREESVDFSNYLLIYVFLANLLITFGASLLISLLVEVPLMRLEKIFLVRT